MDWWRRRVRVRRIQQMQEAQAKKKGMVAKLAVKPPPEPAMKVMERVQARRELKRKVRFKRPQSGPKFLFQDIRARFVPKIDPNAPPPKVFDNGRTFIARLEAKGWKALGSGAFSTVLAKGESTRVLKVTRRPDGWINYIKWANDNGYAGTFAPKVFSYKYIQGKEGNNFSIASMERLPSTLGHLKYTHDAHVVESLLHPAANDNQLAGTLLDLAVPGLREFNQKLRDTFGHLDLHGGNFMVRDSGELVFTDPVSSVDDAVLTERLRFAS